MTLGRRDRLILLSPAILMGILALAPTLDETTTFCPFALSTGIACPGCGMTRAASRLVKGDFEAALSFHPLVPAVALVGAVGWTWFALRRAGKVQPMSGRLLNGILIATSVALIVVWVARLLSGTLPPV